MEVKKCKICRRVGAKLFLKGEKCLSSKCLMTRKPYPPGTKKKRQGRSISEYGKELKEKQKLRNWYNLEEKQFKKYVKEVLEKRKEFGDEDAGVLLIKKLENRFDSIVFRLGFSASRSQAKQMVSHGHFLINGRKIDIPSYALKKGDVVSLSPKLQKKTLYQNLANILKKYTPPSWLQLNAEKMEGKIIGEPNLEEVSPPAEISAIFEFYSR